MASEKRPQVGPTWLKATERRMELLIISEITYWVSHWDPQRGRSVRCGGTACYHCQQGAQKIVRGVVLGIDSSGREKLLEIRDRHERIFESYDTSVGLRISVRKTGPARNSPIDMTVLREELAYRRDISRLVDSLGEPAVILGETEAERAERVDRQNEAAEKYNEEHGRVPVTWVTDRDLREEEIR